MFNTNKNDNEKHHVTYIHHTVVYLQAVSTNTINAKTIIIQYITEYAAINIAFTY